MDVNGKKQKTNRNWNSGDYLNVLIIKVKNRENSMLKNKKIIKPDVFRSIDRSISL